MGSPADLSQRIAHRRPRIASSPAFLDHTSRAGITRNVRTAISVALLMLSAAGTHAQRRGAFVAGPPYAGRPTVPAVMGTPGAALWNPGAPSNPGCCAGSGLNGKWHGHSNDRDRNPAILAVPVPVLVGGGEPDPGPGPAEDQPLNQPPPEGPPPPIAIPPAVPAVSGGSTGNPGPGEVSGRQCISPVASEPPEPPHVLIALDNGWIYAAVAYWVDSETLHYITTRGDHNQVSLNLVNREISARLNKDSQIAFVLP